jgi:TRAP-type transport system small permease protein
MSVLVALERGLLGGVMAAIALVTFLQVVFRYVFALPLEWSEEVGRFLLVWLTFVGAGALVRQVDGHPAVDTLPKAVGPGARRLLEATSRGLVVLGCAGMAWGGARMTWLQWTQTSPSLEISMGLVYLCLPIGGVLGLVWSAWAVVSRGADGRR